MNKTLHAQKQKCHAHLLLTTLYYLYSARTTSRNAKSRPGLRSHTAGQWKDRILDQSKRGSKGNVLGKVSRKMRRKRNRDHETYEERKVDISVPSWKRQL